MDLNVNLHTKFLMKLFQDQIILNENTFHVKRDYTNDNQWMLNSASYWGKGKHCSLYFQTHSKAC